MLIVIIILYKKIVSKLIRVYSQKQIQSETTVSMLNMDIFKIVFLCI